MLLPPTIALSSLKAASTVSLRQSFMTKGGCRLKLVIFQVKYGYHLRRDEELRQELCVLWAS